MDGGPFTKLLVTSSLLNPPQNFWYGFNTLQCIRSQIKDHSNCYVSMLAHHWGGVVPPSCVTGGYHLRCQVMCCRSVGPTRAAPRLWGGVPVTRSARKAPDLWDPAEWDWRWSCRHHSRRQSAAEKDNVLPFNRRCRIYSGFHFVLAH